MILPLISFVPFFKSLFWTVALSVYFGFTRFFCFSVFHFRHLFNVFFRYFLILYYSFLFNFSAVSRFNAHVEFAAFVTMAGRCTWSASPNHLVNEIVSAQKPVSKLSSRVIFDPTEGVRRKKKGKRKTNKEKRDARKRNSFCSIHNLARENVSWTESPLFFPAVFYRNFHWS